MAFGLLAVFSSDTLTSMLGCSLFKFLFQMLLLGFAVLCVIGNSLTSRDTHNMLPLLQLLSNFG